ncbi:hypothetical protein [Bacillus sp. NPDC094106]|uniref:hypothetical protein n=1 Tax=Bacillus sp. NPDC094106 TaxID=3363949 RepID=UPI0038031B8C
MLNKEQDHKLDELMEESKSIINEATLLLKDKSIETCLELIKNEKLRSVLSHSNQMVITKNIEDYLNKHIIPSNGIFHFGMHGSFETVIYLYLEDETVGFLHLGSLKLHIFNSFCSQYTVLPAKMLQTKTEVAYFKYQLKEMDKHKKKLEGFPKRLLKTTANELKSIVKKKQELKKRNSSLKMKLSKYQDAYKKAKSEETIRRARAELLSIIENLKELGIDSCYREWEPSKVYQIFKKKDREICYGSKCLAETKGKVIVYQGDFSKKEFLLQRFDKFDFIDFKEVFEENGFNCSIKDEVLLVEKNGFAYELYLDGTIEIHDSNASLVDLLEVEEISRILLGVDLSCFMP